MLNNYLWEAGTVLHAAVHPPDFHHCACPHCWRSEFHGYKESKDMTTCHQVRVGNVNDLIDSDFVMCDFCAHQWIVSVLTPTPSMRDGLLWKFRYRLDLPQFDNLRLVARHYQESRRSVDWMRELYHSDLWKLRVAELSR